MDEDGKACEVSVGLREALRTEPLTIMTLQDRNGRVDAHMGLSSPCWERARSVCASLMCVRTCTCPCVAECACVRTPATGLHCPFLSQRQRRGREKVPLHGRVMCLNGLESCFRCKYMRERLVSMSCHIVGLSGPWRKSSVSVGLQPTKNPKSICSLCIYETGKIRSD